MTLWERSLYTNPYIDYMINREIIEYDMRDAGFSLIKKYNLSNERKIEWLGRLEKKERKIAIGIMQRDDRDFNMKFQEAFSEGRKLFFEANGLSDKDVLSIRRDAIFTTRMCHHLDYGELQYADKKQYTSFFKFGKLEYYYNRSNGSDIKGINDVKLKLHQDYFLGILNVLFGCIESRDYDKGAQILSEFTTYYKRKELNINYYREMNSDSLFRLEDKINGVTWGIEYIDFDNIPLVDIKFNFNTYLKPLIPLLMR